MACDPSLFAILGLGRKPVNAEAFRASCRTAIEKYSRQLLREAASSECQQRLFYLRGVVEDPATYREFIWQSRQHPLRKLVSI
jgi:glucose-6-phosphate 1-dehydrogenase